MAIVLLQGDDSVLLAQEVKSQVDGLVDGADASLMVEEVNERTYTDEDGVLDIGPVINAIQTPAFLTPRRIVVARNMSLFSTKQDVQPLVDVLGTDLATTDVVLVWEKGDNSSRLSAVPKSLKEALKSCGATQINAAPKGKARKTMLQDKLDMAAVNLNQGARNEIMDVLGDNVGGADSLLNLLESAFGVGAKLGAQEVRPFLPQASDIAPWDLTDAIDSGKVSLALEKLNRMLSGGQRHPLQVMSILNGHYTKALTLDGAPVSNESQAAALLGMKGSTFPAKKAMSLSRRLGSKRIKRAVSLLAAADLDLRGKSALEPQVVTEVLVARLAHLSS